MKTTKSTVYATLAVSSLIFFGLALIPWHESKSNERLPLGAAYVNNICGWEVILLLVPHIVISLAVGASIVFLVQLGNKKSS